MKKLMIVSALLLAAFGTPALAQTAQPTSATNTSQPATTNPSSCFNCANTTNIIAGTTVFFGGAVQGGFGSFDVDGNLVANPHMTGKVEFTKEGGGASNTDLTYAGSICGPLCGSTTLKAQGNAWEKGTVKVTGMSTTGGVMAVGTNGATLASGASIAFGYTNGTPPTTHTQNGVAP